MKFEDQSIPFQINYSEIGTCTIQFAENEGIAFQKERRKIYLVANGTEILYVGEAHTSIKERFRRSCTAFNFFINKDRKEARGGYKGNKWLDTEKNTSRNLVVHVFVIDESYDTNRDFIEAIEGELVYLIRKNTAHWPEYQNEIHFHNELGAAEIAEGIMNEVLRK